ncbi:hypothetical protein ACPS111642_08675 [Acinetobacter pseudolwoffii]
MANNSSNLDIGALSKLVGGLIGGNGEIDIAQIAQLVSGLIGGSGG